jgi:hypothetical protein
LATSSAGSEKHEDGWAARLLRKVLPAANPDFEPLYGGVRLWWVEVDDNGAPQREIGFGSGSEVLVVGPLEENMGFWTDSPMVFSSSDLEQIDAQAFEAYWSRFVATWYASRFSKRGA